MTRRIGFALTTTLLALLLGGCTVHVKKKKAAEPAPPPPAPSTKWVFLGERLVDFGVDRDVIGVGHKGKFRKIQLRVKKKGIKLLDLTVVFGNGQRFDVPVRKYFAKGGVTRVIDLPGGRRHIRKVELVYKSRPGSRGHGRALVRVFGRR